MKLLFLFFIASILSSVVYLFLTVINKKRKKSKKPSWNKPLAISGIVFVLLVGCITYGAYASGNQPDTQCTGIYTKVSVPAVPVVDTANGYFKQGDFYYEHGNCQQAVIDYTKALELNPKFYQAYNNRAYTNMRLRNYKDALPDLDKAIQLNPSYVQALMNRGDIHNFYYQIDRQAAIADYKRVIALTNPSTRQQTSVCGHLFLAKHNGWTIGAYIGYFIGEWAACK